MTTYYMATTGNNANAGTIGSPRKTLASAATLLTAAGDILYIRGGTYTDKSFNFPPVIGTAANPIIVSAYPGETVIFDGGSTASNFFNSGASSGASKFVQFKNFTIQNYGIRGGAASGSGMWFGWFQEGTYSQGIKIINCTFDTIGSHTTQDHGVYFSHGCQSAEVSNCTFINCAGAGVQNAHAPGLRTAAIHDNLFFQGHWGIILGDGASAVAVTNNLFVETIGVETSYSEKDNASYPASGTIDLVIASNIFRSCSTAIVVNTQDHGSPLYQANCFYQCTTIGRTGTNSVQSNPLHTSYNSTGTGDYHLQDTSPCIGTGTSTFATALDRDGVARPINGTRYDIGPYQNTASPPTDITAPILTSPSGVNTGSTTANGTVTTDEGNGTLYCLVNTSPTATQAAVLASAFTQAITTTGSKTIGVTGLSPATTYYAHFAHTDAAGNTSAVVNSASFDTDSVSINSNHTGGSSRRIFHRP